jgi:hypothetical protein
VAVRKAVQYPEPSNGQNRWNIIEVSDVKVMRAGGPKMYFSIKAWPTHEIVR